MNQNEEFAEYEIDLREYIEILWKGKWIIFGLVMVSSLAAGIISQFVMIPVYQTEAEFLAPSFTLLSGRQLKKQDYLSFIGKNQIKKRIVDKFDLKEGNPDFSIKNLDEDLTLNTEEGQKLVKLQFRNSDPQLAKEILNFWVDSFQKRVNTFINKQDNDYLQSLKTSMKENQEHQERVLSKWTAFQKKVNLSLLTSQLEKKEDRLVAIEKRINNLKIKTRKLNKRYKKVIEQVKGTDKFIVLKEVVSDSSLRKLKSIISIPEELNNLTTEREEINTQYNELVSKKLDLEQQLTSHRLELKLLKEEKSNLEQEIMNLQRKTANFKQQKRSLENKLKIADKNYRSAENKYTNALQKSSEKVYQIEVLNRAIQPEEPVSPNVKLNIAIASILGLMLGSFIVFSKEFLNEA
ncbi:GumC family protein [Sporohalobacter salinus]|uniref:GumC family protein n=1 Tax=Sporohalobacter salinus TaxID=1494606 RepID=UPI00195F8EC2|nr:Wzz/FepE/Etk N-terminal domain-containing protein [Sporohalobacter salinus]MBM7623003.1 capsular polysaccharide biosynthesis protein [Sporohalobacter salinus]